MNYHISLNKRPGHLFKYRSYKRGVSSRGRLFQKSNNEEKAKKNTVNFQLEYANLLTILSCCPDMPRLNFPPCEFTFSKTTAYTSGKRYLEVELALYVALKKNKRTALFLSEQHKEKKP